LDGHRLVALGVERGDHRPRRGQGDVVLRRAAAEENRDANPPAHGEVGGGGGGSPETSWPTVIRTVEPCLAFVRPVGLWLSTIPSRPGSVTVWRETVTVKPAPSSHDRARSHALLLSR